MDRLRSAKWISVFAVLGIGALLAMNEISRVLGEVSVEGATYSVNALYGVSAWPGAAHTAMAAWATAACGGIPVRGWLADNLLLDVPFIAAYTGALLGLSRRWNLRVDMVVMALAVADLLEDALAAFAIRGLPGGVDSSACARTGTHPTTYASHHLLFGAMFAVTGLKWLLAALLAVWSVFRIWRARGDRVANPPILLRALKVQRFPIGIAALLAALLLLPNGDVFDQSAEIERGWVLGHRWVGAWYLLCALLAMIGLAAALRYLASVHVAGVRDIYSDADGDRATAADPPRPVPVSLGALRRWLRAYPGLGWRALNERAAPDADQRLTGVWWAWLVGAGVFAGAAAGLDATGAAQIQWTAVACVAGVLLAVPVLTFVTGAAAVRDDPGGHRPGLDALAWRIGRLTAWTVPVIFLLSLTRAYTAPVLLGQGNAVATLVGVVAIVAAAGLIYWVLTHHHVYAPPADTSSRGGWVHPWLSGRAPARTPEGPNVWRRLIAPLVATAVVGLAMILWPVHVSDVVGMMAVVALGLGVITTFYTALAILGQSIAPPRFFRVIALRSTPLITLVTVMGLLSTTLGNTDALHHIRGPRSSENVAALARFTDTTLPIAMSRWLGDTTTTRKCAIAVPRANVDGHPVRIRPLIMVASEGGGVRAAWWTVDVLSHMQGCARSSIFMASGVSGGAVGVAVMDTAPNPLAAMRTMAGQGALAAGTDGLIIRDTVSGVFGLDVDAVDGPRGDRYPDRSALIEQGWEKADPGLAQPFPQPRTGRGPGVDQMPWYTVFNSTSALTRCRVTTSDVDLYTPPDPRRPLSVQPEPATCAIRDPAQAPRDAVAGSYNLLAAFPCLAGLRVSTASINAGRFPYLTPSGVARRCTTGTHAGANGARGDQLIDGGYSENTGVATLNDTLLATMPQIRAHNTAAVASAEASTLPHAPITVVLPMIVFLHNTVTTTPAPLNAPVKEEPEPIIPPVAGLAPGGVLSSRDTLLQSANLITADWLPAGQTSAGVVSAVNGYLPTRTITVAPHELPQVAPPLGWSMSRASEKSLDESYNAYLTCSGGPSCRDTMEFRTLLGAWKIPLTFAAQ